MSSQYSSKRHLASPYSSGRGDAAAVQFKTDATGAPVAPRQASMVAAAGGNAQQLINMWDRSSRPQRIDLLSRFIARHKNSTAAEMEEVLGAAGLLFFSRIVTSMRLTYQLGYELSVQLSALSLFLQGQRFLTSFAEIGGIEMVTDILRFTSSEGRDASKTTKVGERTSSGSIIQRDDKRNALVLLIHLANSGRVYRELVCDREGLNHIIASALRENDATTLEFYTSLFLSLGQGNPRKASLVHSGLLELTQNGCDESALCAASVLRALQMSREQAVVESSLPPPSSPTALPRIQMQRGSPSGSAGIGVPIVGVDSGSPESVSRFLDTLFHLLRSDNVKLRFEGVELLSLASKNLALVVPIVDRCLHALDGEVPASPPTIGTQQKSSGLPPITLVGAKSKGNGELPSSTSTQAPAFLGLGGDLKEIKAKAQQRRLQLSCGRALCSILLQPGDDTRVRLYRHLESRGGHMSLIKYLAMCDSRNDTAIDEACRALRLVSYVPAISEGYCEIDKVIAYSRTAAYLSAVLGRDLLAKVLEGAEMSREQILILYKALRRESMGTHSAAKGHRSAHSKSDGGKTVDEAAESEEEEDDAYDEEE